MPVSTHNKQILHVLASIERASGQQLCLKILAPEKGQDTVLGQALDRYGLHNSEFCKGIKKRYSANCIECDLRRVPLLCDEKRRPFVHTCHAGASELIIPIVLEGQLAAIVYLGQFRMRRSQPGILPILGPDKIGYLTGLAQIVRSYIVEQLNTPRFSSQTSQGYRKASIITFLRSNLRENPSLQDLSLHLGVSPSRAAHAVIEATGSSFTSLKDSMRLERARGLLQTTYHKVSTISSDCGFSSPQYFHRFFQRHTGMTPGAFRLQHRTEV